MKITMPLLAAIAVIATAPAAHAQMKLPDLKKQPTPQAVLDEHFAALNACDWDRLMAQYPEEAQVNLPNGMIVKGRQAASAKTRKTAGSREFTSSPSTRPPSTAPLPPNGWRRRHSLPSHIAARTPTSRMTATCRRWSRRSTVAR
jgi:hypothetical protein